MDDDLSLKNAITFFIMFVFCSCWVLTQGCSDSPSENKIGPRVKKTIIGFSLGTLREQRWLRDRDWFIEHAAHLGAGVNVLFANNDSDLQISQSENLILQGVDVLVVVPHNSRAGAEIVKTAHQHGVKVLAYDRIINNCDLDFYVSFDNEKVGELQAQGVLEHQPRGAFAYIGGSESDYNAHLLKKGSMKILAPLIQSHTIHLVIDNFTPDWKPEEAYRRLHAYLKQQGTLDAVICANDGTAFGAIQALKEFDLNGKVPVSGQDAELAACRRILDGTQTFTVYKPIKQLAYRAAEIAVALAQKKSITANREVDNGQKVVRSYLIDPILVSRKNLAATVIKDGFYTPEQLYQTHRPSPPKIKTPR